MKLTSIKAFSKKNRKTTYTVLAAGLLAAISVVGTVAAAGPAFNIFPIAYNGATNTDYPLLDGRNVTKSEGWSTSQVDHDAGIATDPGDTVEFLIYYHNGAPDAPENIANNVIARASIPAGAGNTFFVGASLSATDSAGNAISASSAQTQKGGDVRVSISGNVGQTLSLVSGSTVWMPNRGTSSQVMPDTIATSGISLGNIQGCWNYAGFVKFRARVSQTQPQLSLGIVKTVKNVTAGGTAYVDSVNANPGDIVEFKIVATNTGDTLLNHVYVSDTLPSRLTFVDGSMTTSQSPIEGNLFSSGGLNMGSVAAGSSVTITFRATVADATQFPVGTTELTNTGATFSLNPQFISPVSDTARVVVTKSAPQVCTISARATFNGSPFSGNVNYSISGPASFSDSVVPKDFPGQPAGTYSASYISGGPASSRFDGVTPTSGNCPTGGSLTFTFLFSTLPVQTMTIDKTVKNITTGTAFADSTTANPSQNIEFKILVKNTGNVDATSAYVRDVLPEKMTYITGSLTIDGTSVTPNDFFGATGKSLGTLISNQTKTIIFRTTLDGQNSFPVGTTSLTNTGYTRATSISEISDTARVDVIKQAPQKEDGNAPGRPT